MNALHVVLIVACVALVAYVWRRTRANVAGQRAQMFEHCRALFDQPDVTERSGLFPLLNGRYRETAFRLEAIPDAIGYRKIPSLWMQVTLLATLPVGGTLDILARAQNIEFFSPSDTLDVALAVPASWPQPITMRANRAVHGLDLAKIESLVAALFSDTRIKELLITQKGLRVIYQLSQAEKSRYLVFRMADFETIDVAPEFLRTLMDDMLRISVAIRLPRTESSQ